MYEDVPLDGTIVKRGFEFEFSPYDQIAATEGRQIKEITRELELSQEVKSIPVNRIVDYSSPDQSLAQIAESNVHLGDERWRFIISQHRKTQKE